MRRMWFALILFSLVAATPASPETRAARSATAAEHSGTAGKSSGAEVAKNTPATANEKSSPREGSAVEMELLELKQMILEQARQLEAQRAAMREQQDKIEELATELRTSRSAHENAASGTPHAGRSGATLAADGTSARDQERQEPAGELKVMAGQLEAVADSTKELSAKVGKIEKEVGDNKKSVEGKIKGFGPFSFNGDLRVRYEPFYGGGPSNLPAPTQRHRERFRLRVNANAKFNDQFSGGFSLATGDPGDPISTNQTMTGFFTRKPILIDRAFVTYSPGFYKPFQITAGKWAYSWYRTELTWDNDLNPEGVSESFTWKWKDSFLQRLSLIAFQLNVSESAGSRDSAVFGEQVQANWKLHDRIKLGTYVAFYNFRQPNAIVANQNGGLGSFGSGFGGNTLTNVSGTLRAGGGRGFASKYGILDAVARLDVDTGISRFPLMAQLDFVQNTKACENVGALVPGTLTFGGCNSHQRHGYWAEAQFGRTQEQGDMRFGYTFIRIEREAVVSAFNFSDLRQATNVANHRLEYAYQWNKNIQLAFTALIGRQLGQVRAGTPPVLATERFLKRLQFDMIYKF